MTTNGNTLTEIPRDINERSRFDQACYFRESGCIVHPLYSPKDQGDSPGKRPKLSMEQRWNISDAEFREFFEGGDNNIGLTPDHGHVILDLDSKEDDGKTVGEFLKQNQSLQSVPCEQTQGGVHLHLLVTGIPDKFYLGEKPFEAALVQNKLWHGMCAEMYYHPPHNVVIAPSVHKSGHQYLWTVTGPLPVWTWEQVKEIFKFDSYSTEPKKQAGRPKKPNDHWKYRFDGDLRTLNIVAMLTEENSRGETLAREINEDKHMITVMCPWFADHGGVRPGGNGDRAAGPIEAFIFYGGENRLPGFKCHHAHCVERGIKDYLLAIEERCPGLVDRHCRKKRMEAKAEDGRPRVELPKNGRPGEAIELATFATTLGTLLERMDFLFSYQDMVSQIQDEPKWRKKVVDGRDILIEGEERLQFRGLSASAAELQTRFEFGGYHKVKDALDKKGNQVYEWSTVSDFNADRVLATSQLRSRLPRVGRILDVPIPIRVGNQIVLPIPGYDPKQETYVSQSAPIVRSNMPIDEARDWIDRILFGFCFADDQSRTHAIARMFSPYLRGLIGWIHKHPLWLFLANRPRAGKDYLNGVTQILYTGHAFEGAPLAQSTDENRKYITAALCGGRRMINFANCQGFISCGNFMSLITNSRMSVRMLGSSSAEAYLDLQNEADVSISGNVGSLTYQADVADRARIVRLSFYEEDANSRTFEIPHLHDYVMEHRSDILSAIHAHVREWITAGMALGTTPFTSFPRWAEVVGGVLGHHGYGDPCLKDGGEITGDPELESVSALFELMYDAAPDKPVKRAAISALAIKASREDYHLNWFGDLNTADGRLKIGRTITLYVDRTVSGITLKRANTTEKRDKQQFFFTKRHSETGGFDPRNRKVKTENPLLGHLAENNSEGENRSNSALKPENSSFGKTGGVTPKIPQKRPLEPQNRPFMPEKGVGRGRSIYRRRDEQIIPEEDEREEEETDNYLSVAESSRANRPRPTPSPFQLTPQTPYQVVGTDAELAAICDRLTRANAPVALDIETYGKDAFDCFQADVRLIQIKVPGEPAYLIDRYVIKVLAPLKSLLESSEVIGHNLAFEYKFLRQKLGIRIKRCWDTQSAARISSNNDATNTTYVKLGDLISDCLGIDLAKEEGGSDWSAQKLTASQLQYAADDVGFLHQLKDNLEQEIKEAELERTFELEMRVLPIAAQMHLTGIAVDRTEVQAIIDQSAINVKTQTEKVRNIFNKPELNLKSPKQLLEAFQEAGIEIEKTDEETLCVLEHAAAEAVLAARGAIKQSEEARRYLKEIGEDGRIHAEFDPLGTNTGRFSSSKPNIQNVSSLNKSSMRRAFKAPAGRCIIDSDYQQMEMRAVAKFSKERRMNEAFDNNEDLHRRTAARALYNIPEAEVTKYQRQTAKPANFGLIYFEGSEGFRNNARTYGIRWTIEQAAEARVKFFDYYKDLAAWHQTIRDEGAFEGRTLLGRRRKLAKGGKWWQCQARCNYLVQGSCADAVKLAMCTISDALPPTAAIVHTVHDEIIVECDEADSEAVNALVKEHMEEASRVIFSDYDCTLPADAKVCVSWADKDL
jgi:DNA polymerase-1